MIAKAIIDDDDDDICENDEDEEEDDEEEEDEEKDEEFDSGSSSHEVGDRISTSRFEFHALFFYLFCTKAWVQNWAIVKLPS